MRPYPFTDLYKKKYHKKGQDVTRCLGLDLFEKEPVLITAKNFVVVVISKVFRKLSLNPERNPPLFYSLLC